MPLFRTPKSPYWWYDFRYGGKRYRASTRETVKAAARAFEREAMASVEAGEYATRGKRPPLLRDFLPTFLASFEQNQLRAAKTKRYYRNGARLLMDTALKEFPIDRITTSIIAAVQFPHSAYNGNNAVRTLRRVLGYAVELGYLKTVPRMHLYRETARTQMFTPEHESRLLAVAPQPLHDVFIVLMDTGMRPEEVYRMRWSEIDWTLNMITVSAGKTAAASRTIGISQRVRELLTRRVRETGHSEWVFPSRKRGKHISTVNKAFAKARTKAGLPPSLVLYAARHTFGTDVMGATGNSKLTMMSMGHTDVKTSARYQHPGTGQIANIIDARNESRKFGHTFSHTDQHPN